MASVVGQASAAATSVAIPAHNVGDLIIVSARGTAAAPSVPAAGGTVPAWATIQSGLANAIGLTVVSFVATATTTTTGVFTNATHICVLVLRAGGSNKLQTSAARSSVGNGNNTQTIIYPALALNNGGGASTSFGVRVGTRTVAITAVGTPPAGWTNQSIQPAGASALMSVHSLAPLTSNPTADTVTVTSSNAAYRAVTIEVEEVPLINVLGNVGVAGAAVVAPSLNKIVPFDATVVGAAAVLGQQVPPVSFAIDITTNVPYAGEHLIGTFLIGDEDILAVDLTTIHLDVLDGLIAGQASVGASLAVVRGVAVDITRAAALVAQANEVRGLAVPVSGVGAVSADLIRASVVATMAASAQGQAQVAADLSISSVITYTQFAAAISGQALVAPDIRTALPASSLIQGQAQVTAALGRTVGLGVSVQGQGQVGIDGGSTKSMAVSIARSGAIVAQSSRVIMLDVRIQAVVPLIGEHIIGTFLIGITDGPFARVFADTVRTVNYPVSVQGQTQIDALLRTSLPFAAGIQGQANLQAQAVLRLALAAGIQGKAEILPPLNLRLALAALIQGKALVSAKMRIAWLTQTIPGNVLLPPTTEGAWILVPTSEGVIALAPTAEGSVVLAPTDEEDVLLVPTVERG